MRDKIDCSTYLSIDNGNGLLIRQNDAFVLEKYNINYSQCFSMSDLILIVGRYIDDNCDYDLDDLKDVLSNLLESHYYNETKK